MNVLLDFLRASGVPALSDAEAEANRAAYEAERRAAAEQRRADEARAREAATVTAGALRYIPADAIRLSQLSARSWGAGQDRRGVTHALVVGNYSRGRLSRRDGQFLCSASLRPWDVSERPGRPVSCPACLAQIAKAEGSDA